MSVGLFVTLGIAALIFLAMKVASAGISGSGETYTIYAKFDNIGGLKVRSSVKVGGVVVGRQRPQAGGSGPHRPQRPSPIARRRRG